jgi:hypothetical protein
MWTIFIIVLFAVILACLFVKKTKKKELDNDIYVCDICGEKDCICHKENTET